MHNNSLTNYLKAQKNLQLLSQGHLLDAFAPLPKEEQEVLIQDILSIDLKKFQKQQALFSQTKQEHKEIKPYQALKKSGDPHKTKIGLDAVANGLCGALLIAGGQGTRLGHPGPKGTFPIVPITHKSLFQIFCEKIKKTSVEVGQELPLAIMTSPLNDTLTRRFFAQHQNFGLKENQIVFFTQKMLPLLDLQGKLFLKERNQIAFGPDGNGGCSKEFVQQNIYEEWKSRGIKYLNIILVDNPLADPYDFELFGELIDSKSDLTLKSCTRLSPNEKVGVIVSKKNKPVVIEYHEIPDDCIFSEEPAANLSLFALTLDFLKLASKLDLPLHKVGKKSPYYNIEIQKLINPKIKSNCWKFETYLFDILSASEKTTVLTYPREQIFCPLKNKSGEFSPSAVRKSLFQIGIQ